MKILYDHQMFTMQRFGGVTRYFAELMACLPIGYEACLPKGLWSDNYYLAETVGLPLRSLRRPFNFRIRRRLYYFMNQVSARKAVRNVSGSAYDVLHPTWYHPYVLRHRRRPLVITVHDLIQERYPDVFLFYDRNVQNKRRLMQEADHIIAVSRQTKEDIVALAGIAPDKITVVHHGYRATVSPSAALGTHYILFVGDRRRYKNFDTFVEAVAPLLKLDKHLTVICAGPAFTEVEQAMFKRFALGDRIRAIQATDAQLMSLYRYADVFVYPSLYEGFGIPILEAFANGCPVCLSRASCFPEVAGDAAVYFDPTSSDEMRNVVGEVLYNSALASRLRAAGQERVKGFSIEKMVAETCSVYNRLR